MIRNPAKIMTMKNIIDIISKGEGRADELGSGVKNIFLFTKAYSGADPQTMEADIFRIVIPLTAQVTEQATEQATGQVTEQAKGWI